MSPELVAFFIGGFIVIMTFVVLIVRKMPKRLKTVYYVRKWRDIQKMCRNQDDWSHAIIRADMLLDEALTKKKIAGKTMGERLVNAESDFSSKDIVWSAHKLAGNLRENGVKKMNETKVKDTLIAFRTALKDLGAIK